MRTKQQLMNIEKSKRPTIWKDIEYYLAKWDRQYHSFQIVGRFSFFDV
jgi:hypothetical protein